MKYFISFFTLLSLSLSLFAIPAKKISIFKFLQSTGDTLNIIMIGDEFHKIRMTTDSIPIYIGEDNTYYYSEIDNNQIVCGHIIAKNPDLRTPEEDRFVKSQKDLLFSQLKKEREERKISRRRLTKNQQTTRTTIATKNTITKPKYIVLLVEFDDVHFNSNHDLSLFEDMLNKTDFNYQNATGSVKQYFKDQSFGLFDPQYDVVGPIRLSNKMSYYGKNDKDGLDVKPDYMVKEACEIANSNFNVDFSEYDNDNDNELDFVYVLYAGYGESQSNEPNQIWPHAWSISHHNLKLNNVKITNYACSSELSGSRGSNLDGIGTMCHELSHILGLPDFYDVDYSGNFGLSYWDLMDSGCYLNEGKTPCGYSSFERFSVGWLEPLELKNTSMNVTLEPLNISNNACIMYSDQSSNEYFMFENRQKTGWDKYLPASGMLITSICYDKKKWDENCVNNEFNKQNVTIIPADNELLDLEWEEYDNWDEFYSSLEADTYPGITKNTSFTKTSSPNSKFFSDYIIDRPITEIEEKDGKITFKYLGSIINNLSTAQNSPLDIYSKQGKLVIENGSKEQIIIYSTMGSIIKSINISSDLEEISLEKGLYYIKADKTYKIIIP